MPTPFDEIYDFFLAKVTDYSFAQFTEVEIEEEFEKYLRSASSKFMIARDRLEKDHEAKEFTNDLTDLEKEIISILMVIEYLNPKIISTENMKQFLGSRDYQIYSQANHLQRMMELKDMMKREANSLMSQYSYQNGLSELE